MKPIPLPSHVHYELLLQVLERQTLAAAEQQPAIKGQIKQLIISLRKAFVQQKQLEDLCQQTQFPVEYRWSLNSLNVDLESDHQPIAPPES